MNLLCKILSISVISIICASNVCAHGRSLAFSSDVGAAYAKRGTLTGSLGHTDIERITPEFHFGLDAEAHNLRWNLAPGETKAIEYDANGVKEKEWEYIYNDKTKSNEWIYKPIK